MSTFRQAFDTQKEAWQLVQQVTGRDPISLAVIRLADGWGLRVGLPSALTAKLPDMLDGVPIVIIAEERARLLG